MATGHILPGYGQPVSTLRRAKSAFPLDKTKIKEYALYSVPAPEPSELLGIKDEARKQWMRLDRTETTYDFQFRGKRIEEAPKFRPSSPTRRNKPHPPLVFLTNRLHYIPGYHNADSTLNKPVYQVDASLSPEEQYYRRSIRDKYIGRPSSAAMNQYRDTFGYKETMEPEEAQAAEAWTKLADENNQVQFFGAWDEHKNRQVVDNKPPEHPYYTDDNTGMRPTTAIPSLHRWMKYAGPAENANLNVRVEDLNTDRENMPNVMRYSRSPVGSTEGIRRQQIHTMQRTRYTRKPSRGEFVMHPDWPSNIPHHRVP